MTHDTRFRSNRSIQIGLRDDIALRDHVMAQPPVVEGFGARTPAAVETPDVGRGFEEREPRAGDIETAVRAVERTRALLRWQCDRLRELIGAHEATR